MHVAVTSPSCRLVTVQRHEKPCFTKCVFAGASYCTVMEIEQSHSTGHTSSTAVFGSCRRCEQLQSLNEEYYVLSLLDVLVAHVTTSETLVLYTTCYYHPLPASEFSFSLTSLSHDLLSLVFNVYRREGHQFSVQTYNKLLLSWATQVNYRFDLVFFWPLPLYSLL